MQDSGFGNSNIHVYTQWQIQGAWWVCDNPTPHPLTKAKFMRKKISIKRV